MWNRGLTWLLQSKGVNVQTCKTYIRKGGLDSSHGKQFQPTNPPSAFKDNPCSQIADDEWSPHGWNPPRLKSRRAFTKQYHQIANITSTRLSRIMRAKETQCCQSLKTVSCDRCERNNAKLSFEMTNATMYFWSDTATWTRRLSALLRLVRGDYGASDFCQNCMDAKTHTVIWRCEQSNTRSCQS